MTDELKHECAVALVVLRKDGEHYRAKYGSSDYGGTKLSLLLEKQHNRGQDGAGAAILASHPVPGAAPYLLFKSASDTPLVDVLKAITKRTASFSHKEHRELKERCDLCAKNKERIFLGHLRYATFGKNDVAYCHPFVHEASELEHTLLLAGNFNLTNAPELFENYASHGSFPTSRADGYLICELIAKGLHKPLASALADALADADGAWTLIGATGDGTAFATSDPHGIRPGFYYVDEEVVVVASERPAIQAAFDVPPEAVKELPPGEALVVSPEGDVEFADLNRAEHVERVESNASDLHASTRSTRLNNLSVRPCSFERIYFSRANDAAIHRERKALGAALVPQILNAADAPMERIFFSYIPNSARIAFHGLLEALFVECPTQSSQSPQNEKLEATSRSLRTSRATFIPRFGEVIVKDAKFRTFIADAAARREFYKHVYDVTYGLVGTDDTLVVLDDSIVRGNTMKNAILPMLDRLGPKRIVIASSAPPIRYPDCYGIDMSTLGELVAFRALVNLLGDDADDRLHDALKSEAQNPLAPLYARFTDEQHCAEITRLLTPPGLKAEVAVVYQTVANLRRCLMSESLGDWYFTGDYPTRGGYKVLHTALLNYLEKNSERSY